MEKFRSVDEILNFAITREVEAIQLYSDLALKVDKPELRIAIEGFIREELEHKEKLETEKAEGIVLKDEEVGNLEIAEHVEGGKVRPDMSYKDLLVLAMKKEAASVKLYTNLAKMAEDEKLKDTFLLLAQEEAEHKLRFELEYDLTFF